MVLWGLTLHCNGLQKPQGSSGGHGPSSLPATGNVAAPGFQTAGIKKISLPEEVGQKGIFRDPHGAFI